MCGRYASARPDAELVEAFGVAETVGSTAPSWNVAPTQQARIVVETGGVRRLCTARWGLVLPWAADDSGSARTINARIETVTEKPAYRDGVLRRRALVPATGYYEWQRTAVGKVAHYLTTEGEDLALAGLWATWHAGDGRSLTSFTVLTRPAPQALSHIHDRAPVVVPRPLIAGWLHPALCDPMAVRRLLEALPPAVLSARVVGPAVNAVTNDGPALIQPGQEQASLFG